VIQYKKNHALMGAVSIFALSFATGSVAAGDTVAFDIASQPIAKALIEFNAQSGVIVVAPVTLVEGLTAPAVRGDMDPKNALVKILQGSGLKLSKAPSGDFMITSTNDADMQHIGYNTAADYRANLGAYVDDGDLGEGAAFELDEIIVTASRREQNLQDVPMALTVVRPEEFTAVGLTRLSDVIAYTPGVTVTDSLGFPVGATITARGVGQQGGTATVGVYVDTVPLSSNGPWGLGGQFAFDGLLGDVERVEFLKGPQGTLYGSTSIGGAVKYITRKPSLDEFRGHASVDLSGTRDGGFNQLYSGRISTPLVEGKLGLTVAGFYEDNGGFVDRVDGTGALLEKDSNPYEKYGFSGDVYYEISDRFNFRGRVLHQKADFSGTSRVSLDRDTGQPVFGALTSDNPFSISNVKNTVYTGTIEAGFDWATVTATSSYVETSRFLRLGSAALDLDLDVGSEKFTQEMQITSETSDTWEWVVGLYYTDEMTFQTLAAISQPSGSNLLTSATPSEYKEYAAFGNLTYYVTSEFDMTVGARLSRNQMSFREEASGLLAGTAEPFTNTIKDTVNTWLFAARYRPTENLSLYARMASGYRPASANRDRVDPNDSTRRLPRLIESDSLWSYEVGAKGTMADDFLSYDLVLWYLTWDNFQTALSLTPEITGFANAPGGITAKGIEGSFTLHPLHGLSILTGFAYTESTLNDNEPGLDGEEGQQLPFVPKWTFSSRVNYDFALTDDLDASLGAGIRYQDSSRSAFTDDGAYMPGVSDPSETFDTFFNVPTDSYVAVDLNVNVMWDQVALSLYATNLFNKQAVTGMYSTFADGVFSVPLKPRTIGAWLSVDF